MPLANFDVAILCGGKGTRLSPVIGAHTPKALAVVKGKPVIEHQIDWLKPYGLRRIVLCAGHLHRRISEWRDSYKDTDLKICLSIEAEQRGEIEALKHAQKFFDKQYVIALNGDTLLIGDIASLLNGIKFGASFCVRGTPCGLKILPRLSLDFIPPMYDATGHIEFLDVGTPQGYEKANAA